MSDLLILPVVVPLAASLLAVLLPRHAVQVGLGACTATAAIVGYLVWCVYHAGTLILPLGGWSPGLGIALRVDALAAALLLMTALVACAATISARRYFKHDDEHARFWPLWLLLLTALNALFLAADLFNLYVTLELMGLSAVALAAMGRSRAALQAALRYLVIGLLGSMLLLAGVVLIYARYGTLDLLALEGVLTSEPVALLALGVMSAGLLAKCALFPLHFWLPPAHANAPAPVSAALSALVVKAAVYLLLRLWLELFAPLLTPTTAWLLGLLGAGAVLWGSWQALVAERLKLVAAYSTVAQIGYLFLFFPLLATVPAGAERDALFGVLVLLALTHGFGKSAFFLATGVLQQRLGHDRIRELHGIAQMFPATTFALALAGVALVGLPPSGTFLAKWELMTAAFSAGQWVWTIVVAAGTLLSATYVFRFLGQAFTSADSPLPVAAPRWDIEDWPPLMLALIATAALGLGANKLLEFVIAVPGATS